MCQLKDAINGTHSVVTGSARMWASFRLAPDFVCHNTGNIVTNIILVTLCWTREYHTLH